MPTRTVTTKFFHFCQNNSGGSFVIDRERGLNVSVIIEAQSPEDANRIAEEKGLYFNGCASGRDCSCCGDRWSDQWSDEKGDDTPSIYGTPISDEDDGLAIHYMDGTVEWRD